MNKRRRRIAKRIRQVRAWRREYNILYKMWWDDDEPFRGPRQRRRWYLMRKLGL